MAEQIIQQWVPDSGGLRYRLSDDREYGSQHDVLLDDPGGDQRWLTTPHSFAPVLATALERVGLPS